MNEKNSYIVLIIIFALVGTFFYDILKNLNLSSLMSVLNSWYFKESLQLSLISALAASFISFLPSVLFGYFLSRHNFMGKAFLQVLVILPYSMTPVAIGSLVLIFLASGGIGRAINDALGLLFSIRGAIFVQTILAFSIMTDVYSQLFSMISVEYEELSRSLGYSWISTLVKVLIPMSKEGIIEGYLLGFLKAFTDFGATVMVAGAIMGKTSTIPVTIYILMNSGDIAGAISLIMLSALVSAFLIYFVRKIKVLGVP